jgi:flagellar motor switch protein FliN/FliY
MTDQNERPNKTDPKASSSADERTDALHESPRTAPPSQADGLKSEDTRTEAMVEQTSSESALGVDEPLPSSTAAKPAGSAVFKPLGGDASGGGTDIDLIMDVPVQLTVELGRTRLTIKHLLQLGQGSVVALEGLAGEPMDIFVNGYLIAQGEVVVVEDKYGIRLTDIITPSERIHRLNNRR